MFERYSTKNTDFLRFSHHSRFADDTVLTVITDYAILNGVPDHGDVVWLGFETHAVAHAISDGG